MESEVSFDSIKLEKRRLGIEESHRRTNQWHLNCKKMKITGKNIQKVETVCTLYYTIYR